MSSVHLDFSRENEHKEVELLKKDWTEHQEIPHTPLINAAYHHLLNDIKQTGNDHRFKEDHPKIECILWKYYCKNIEQKCSITPCEPICFVAKPIPEPHTITMLALGLIMAIIFHKWSYDKTCSR